MLRQFRAVLPLVVGLLALARAAQPSQFSVGTASAAPGQKARGFIEVPAGVDAGTQIPVVVVHGTRPGRVLALVAGSHGTEYAGTIGLHALIAQLDPAEVSGTVILLPLVNVPAFERMTPHLNPVDGKNMNRVYPGKPDGSQSERAAWEITRQVVERCDFLIDIHGGDLDESLRPYSYWLKTGDAETDAAARELALAFGLDHILISDDNPKDKGASAYLDNTAALRRKPAVTVEAGCAGTTEADDVLALSRGCLSVMRHLGMLPGAATPVEHPVWIETVASLASQQAGVFRALVRRGSYVEAGMRIGFISDLFGTTIDEARSPVAGVVLQVRAVPSLQKGETIASIGVVAVKPPAGVAR